LELQNNWHGYHSSDFGCCSGENIFEQQKFTTSQVIMNCVNLFLWVSFVLIIVIIGIYLKKFTLATYDMKISYYCIVSFSVLYKYI
jgi:hypothetical protein